MAREKLTEKKVVKSKVVKTKAKKTKANSHKIIAEVTTKPKQKNTNFSLVNGLAIIAVIAMLGAVGYLSSNNSGVNKNNTQTVAAAETVRYDGEDGKNALELLRNKTSNVETQDTSMGTFVTGINNTIDTDTNFWMFYVNDELAQSTPDQYITKNSDKIEWRYEAFN
ncbi:MAG: hypothetical protein UT28_C0001G0011 [Berkelbacteria bacterium GW2011_GWE1_39_12]|uniref:Transcobalamin-like C-terminal domain-containing protein n=1 Tax=Berkelbacteria bacterium GW2011_GWE1_39_12 TaxID=1618337 RepID=A0A0G4B2P5_9BACT|nr:MAG: hypothetical protein UT28_C0001G0011 [Berkelbacteria bacterium GW2011_GWE1_39_12]